MTRLDEIKLQKNGLHIGWDMENHTYYEKNGFIYDIEKCFNSRYFECKIAKKGSTEWIQLCTRANVDTCVAKVINYIKENA